MRKIQIVLTLFIAIGAVAGAVMMWTDPCGNSWGGTPLLEMLKDKMPWQEVFFQDFIPSGFVLLAVNGLPQFLAAWMLVRHHPHAQWVVLACGIILMIWILLEWWIFSFNAMSNIFFAFALIELLTVKFSSASDNQT